MLTMIVEVVGCCTEQYGQLLLKCLKTLQQMQSFFSQYYLIISSETQLICDCF